MKEVYLQSTCGRMIMKALWHVSLSRKVFYFFGVQITTKGYSLPEPFCFFFSVSKMGQSRDMVGEDAWKKELGMPYMLFR